MKKSLLLYLFLLLALNTTVFAQDVPQEIQDQQELQAQESTPKSGNGRNSSGAYTIFDDKMLLDGYTKRYQELSKEILLEMIKDESLSPYKTTAAVRVFNQKYGTEVFSREKKRVEKILLRRLNRDESAFVQVEIMCALCTIDRYRYFKSLVPALIQKLNHYNTTVNENASNCLQKIVESGNGRAREARIVFNTLRKVLFLSRRRLENISEPGPKLSRKLELLRWSIKILGRQELKRLPKEVIPLF